MPVTGGLCLMSMMLVWHALQGEGQLGEKVFRLSGHDEK